MFDALKNLANLPEMLARLREMRQQMAALQEELARRQATAEAGGGLVQATVNGRLELVKLRIDRQRIDPADVEMLEDLIVAAVAAAQKRAAQMVQDELRRKALEHGLPPDLTGLAGS